MVEKNERISIEVKRLTGIFTNISTRQKKAILSLVENAAFMAITLQDLQTAMNENGVISTYQNGENQWGTKKSPEVEIYNTMVKNHAALIKQLTDLLPVEPPKKETDSFDKFLNDS